MGALSDSESDVTDSKSSALAVLAMNKKKELPKPEVKNEPVSSEGEEDVKPLRTFMEAVEEPVIKKEIKTEEGVDLKLQKKKTHLKKEKKRDKETKELSKEKSLLGQKLKMAKIFGTSS